MKKMVKSRFGNDIFFKENFKNLCYLINENNYNFSKLEIDTIQYSNKDFKYENMVMNNIITFENNNAEIHIIEKDNKIDKLIIKEQYENICCRISSKSKINMINYDNKYKKLLIDIRYKNTVMFITMDLITELEEVLTIEQ